jgi:DNA-binding CsgD family transcriptional regulator
MARKRKQNLKYVNFHQFTSVEMTPNALTSPLTSQQQAIWKLLSQGLSVQTIANKLKTTRQYINQTRLTTEAKLSTALLGIAETNHLQVTKLNANQGILLGYHPALNRKAIITYSTNFGVKVWYWNDHPEEVTNQRFLKQAQIYLLDLAKERCLEIENVQTLHPAKLADIIFSKLLPELKE